MRFFPKITENQAQLKKDRIEDLKIFGVPHFLKKCLHSALLHAIIYLGVLLVHFPVKFLYIFLLLFHLKRSKKRAP